MHALANIAAQGAQQTTASHEFNTGRTTAGFSLYEAFCVKAQKDARIDVILSLHALTLAEFDAAVKEAEIAANAADVKAGWLPPEGAKGREKYGPQRNSLVQRASEMRQIFGALKQGLMDGAECKGYLESLRIARLRLKDAGVTWDGRKMEAVKAEKEAAKNTAAVAEASKQAMANLKQQPGESVSAYMARIAEETERLLEENKEKAAEARMSKLASDIIGKESIVDVYSLACALMAHCVVSGAVDAEQCWSDLNADIQAMRADKAPE